ncbi:gliding motility protein RemB [Parapedobacter sp. DT-150]|uniref:gliding motility protein RemB n=1 Tax=Parapedobacter sp. DT-150 TaxID=3396162 RepID=UPI003F1B3A80
MIKHLCDRCCWVMLFAVMLSSQAFVANAQSTYQPYSYHFYQKLNNVLYDADTRLHTSVKPMIIDEALQPRYDSLMELGVAERHSWWGRKLYNEHLIDIKKDDHTFYADFLPDFQLGRDFAGGGRTTWLNTRGAQAGVTIEDNFSLYVNFFENQGVFPEYLDRYIFEHTVTPGQGYGKTMTSSPRKKDWMYGSATMSYTVNKYLNVTLAYDKQFIGDGYRSMLLSDISSNYTALKLTGKLGNVQYMSMWTYMLDPMHPRSLDSTRRAGDNWKWGAFQYLDWNVNNRFSVGLFQSVVWGAKNAAGRRGFDFNYFNPIIFMRPVELTNTSSPDKMHLGLNTKYKALKNLTVYGQFLLGEFVASEFFSGRGHVNNKWAAQLGFRGFDAFGVKDLNFLAEYNTARPYTYAHFDPVSNYSNYGQPLAHPLGSNFRELVGILNYSYKRFDFSLQGTWGQFGSDPDSLTNYGGDIFKTYATHIQVYDNRIAQGVKNNLLYADGRISYLFNPKYNLRVEVGAVYRRHGIPEQGRHPQTGMLTLGLRGSFRNFYYDF